MSPWTIKVATQNRVQHQEGRGHLPLRAEVQAYFQQEHFSGRYSLWQLHLSSLVTYGTVKTVLIGEAYAQPVHTYCQLLCLGMLSILTAVSFTSARSSDDMHDTSST